MSGFNLDLPSLTDAKTELETKTAIPENDRKTLLPTGLQNCP